jgi:aminoglycoside 6'-N-acetyltransferase
MVPTDREISFRPIAPADVPNLVRWQRDPEVAHWYHDSAVLSDQELNDKWIRRTSGTGTPHETNTRRFIITVDASDIGEIQVYDLRDYPVEAKEIGIPNAGGLDLFIGEPEWRDRGVGSRVVRQFVDEMVFGIPGVETCVIEPEPANKRAIRSYEKAGFKFAKTYHSYANEMDCYLMRQERIPD